MSATTATTILTNRTLRWSSPLIFNDPFDVPRELSFGITPAQIVDALAKRFAQLLRDPPMETSVLEPKVRLIVDTIKKGVPSEVLAGFLGRLQDVAAQHCPTSESMGALQAVWRHWLPKLRVLCLTESPAHAAMWYHYADQYRGAVLEFACNDNTDSPWLGARRVEYMEAKPAAYTPEGWAELLTLQPELAVKKLLDTSTYTKASDWSYENEWRIVTFKRPGDVGHHTDYTYHAEDLAGVYLGPLIAETDRNAIIANAASFPWVKIVSVSLSMSREFVFNEAGG